MFGGEGVMIPAPLRIFETHTWLKPFKQLQLRMDFEFMEQIWLQKYIYFFIKFK